MLHGKRVCSKILNSVMRSTVFYQVQCDLYYLGLISSLNLIPPRHAQVKLSNEWQLKPTKVRQDN